MTQSLLSLDSLTYHNGDTDGWSRETLLKLSSIYRDSLENSAQFWCSHSIDAEHGGYFTCLDANGSLLQTDKSIWFQGRMAWMFATLYLTVEPRKEWLDAARSGIEFLEAHGFDTDGRMFFSVTREGAPLRKRRYLFSECFAIIAFAAYGAASGQRQYVKRAEELLEMVRHYLYTPGLLEPKTNTATRPMKGLAMPMILIVTAQELRKYSDSPLCKQIIDSSIAEIRNDFLKPELRCLLETVGANGEFIDNFDGRCVNPGHSIEAAWFILEEARVTNADPELIKLATTILDWSLDLGWDQEHGGIFYFRDAKDLPCTEYWHDMKFWWPHNEAIIATLLAYQITGNTEYARWHEKIHNWSYSHFADLEHGEWHGYLHRDGSISTRVKGTLYKGFFHLPRMQWYCWQRVNEMLA